MPSSDNFAPTLTYTLVLAPEEREQRQEEEQTQEEGQEEDMLEEDEREDIASDYVINDTITFMRVEY